MKRRRYFGRGREQRPDGIQMSEESSHRYSLKTDAAQAFTVEHITNALRTFFQAFGDPTDISISKWNDCNGDQPTGHLEIIITRDPQPEPEPAEAEPERFEDRIIRIMQAAVDKLTGSFHAPVPDRLADWIPKPPPAQAIQGMIKQIAPGDTAGEREKWYRNEIVGHLEAIRANPAIIEDVATALRQAGGRRHPNHPEDYETDLNTLASILATLRAYGYLDYAPRPATVFSSPVCAKCGYRDGGTGEHCTLCGHPRSLRHSGSHPITETQCDDKECWCYATNPTPRCHVHKSAGRPWYAAQCVLPTGHHDNHEFGTEAQARQRFEDAMKAGAITEAPAHFTPDRRPGDPGYFEPPPNRPGPRAA